MGNQSSSLMMGRIITRLYPSRGGPAKHAYHLSRVLIGFGVDNAIVTTQTDENSTVTDYEVGQVIRLPVAAAPTSDAFRRFLFAISFVLIGPFVSLLLFLRNRVDLIHAHSPIISGIAGLLVSKLMGKKFVYTLHGLERWSSRQGKRENGGLKCFLEELTASLADAIISVSPDYLYYMKRVWGVERTFHIPNGVDSTQYRPRQTEEEKARLRHQIGLPSNKVLFTYVGNLDLVEKVQGIDDLISAISLLEKTSKNHLELVVVGDGKYLEYLKNVCTNEGLSDSIRFLGHRRDVPNILRASDVFVLPSRNEGSPNSLLEAMSTGLCCMATKCGSIPQMIKETGLIVEPGDIQGIRKTISKLIKDKSLRNRLGQMARERILKKFTWNHVAKRTISVYYRILSQH